MRWVSAFCLFLCGAASALPTPDLFVQELEKEYKALSQEGSRPFPSTPVVREQLNKRGDEVLAPFAKAACDWLAAKYPEVDTESIDDVDAGVSDIRALPARRRVLEWLAESSSIKGDELQGLLVLVLTREESPELRSEALKLASMRTEAQFRAGLGERLQQDARKNSSSMEQKLAMEALVGLVLLSAETERGALADRVNAAMLAPESKMAEWAIYHWGSKLSPTERATFVGRVLKEGQFPSLAKAAAWKLAQKDFREAGISEQYVRELNAAVLGQEGILAQEIRGVLEARVGASEECAPRVAAQGVKPAESTQL